MTHCDSTITQYELMQEVSLPLIEMIDLVYGDRDLVYGTLFVSSWDDLNSQVKPIMDLGLKVGFNPSRSSLEKEMPDWPDGHEKQLNIAVGTSQELVAEFLHHERNDNHNEIGKFLGYPECCVEAFNSHFKDDSTTWTGSAIAEFVLDTTPPFTRAPFYTNRFLRYEYFALLYHFPCHPNCKRSVKIGKRRYNLLRELDSGKAEEIKQVLSSVVIYRVTWSPDSNDILNVTDVLYCSEYTVHSGSKTISIDGTWTVGRPKTDGCFRDIVQNISEMEFGKNTTRELLSELTEDENEEIRIVLYE